ncbi:hypothetical protein [Streptomyces sp. NPDC001401]
MPVLGEVGVLSGLVELLGAVGVLGAAGLLSDPVEAPGTAERLRE